MLLIVVKGIKWALFMLSNVVKGIRRAPFVLYNDQKHITYAHIVLSNVVEGVNLTICMVNCVKMIHCVTSQKIFGLFDELLDGELCLAGAKLQNEKSYF